MSAQKMTPDLVHATIESPPLCDRHLDNDYYPTHCSDCDALQREHDDAIALAAELDAHPVRFSEVPWCGECMSDSRLRLFDPDDYRAGSYRCHKCHPKALTTTALAEVVSRRVSTDAPELQKKAS